jgi:hypothetical protein
MTQPAPKREQRRWTPEDIEILTDLTGELPWQMVVAEFNRRRPARTEYAMLHKVDQLRLLRKPEGEFIAICAIKALTGYSSEKIYLWIDSGDLPAVARSEAKNSPRYISRKSLRAFARKRPEQFGGMGQAELTQLLDCEKLAAKIVEMQLPKLSNSIEIECIETRRRFPSIAAVAKEARVGQKFVSTAIRQGSSVRGRHYRRVDQPAKAHLA